MAESHADPIVSRPAMTEYGVDTPDWEGLPWTWARQRLDAGRNFWLGTVSGDGRPHSLPVWGVWDDDDRQFCFSCAPGSRKGRNLQQNPRCVVTTDDSVECVSLEGTAQLVVDTERQDVWIERYLAKYSVHAADLSAEFIRGSLVFEVVPERAFGIIEREDEFAQRATRWTF